MGRGVTLALAAALVGVVAGVANWARSKFQAGPTLDCPARVDLGTREVGEMATAVFQVHNRGGKPLWVGNIRTECSCVGVEREQEDGTFQKVEECWLNPREVVRFAARVAIRGTPGREIINRIHFSSNDPDRLENDLDIVVPSVRGLLVEPNSFIFGHRLVGTPCVSEVDIYNVGNAPESIIDVSCDNDWFVPAVATDNSRRAGSVPPKGEFLGRLRVTLSAKAPGSWAGAVKVRLRREGQEYEAAIPVSVTIDEAISVSPTRLTLPRRSGEGLAYSATCICRSFTGGPCTVSPAVVPAGISVRIVGPETTPGPPMIEITTAKELKPGRYTVTLKAIGDGSTTSIDLPVDILSVE